MSEPENTRPRPKPAPAAPEPAAEPENRCCYWVSDRSRVRPHPRHVRYVNGNPLNLNDPTGHYLQCGEDQAACEPVIHAEEQAQTKAYYAQQAQLQTVLAASGANSVGQQLHQSPDSVLAGTLFCDGYGLSAKDCASLLKEGSGENQDQADKSKHCSIYGQFYDGDVADAAAGGLAPGCYFITPPQYASGNFGALLQIAPFLVLDALSDGVLGDLGADGGAVTADGAGAGAEASTASVGGENDAAALGRYVHGLAKIDPTSFYGGTFDTEVSLFDEQGQLVGRADAVDWESRTVYELKPDNPRALTRGQSQVNGYAELLTEQTGQQFTGVVMPYDPSAYTVPGS